MEDVFREFDKDGDGFVSCAELKAAMLALDKPMSDLEVVMLNQGFNQGLAPVCRTTSV